VFDGDYALWADFTPPYNADAEFGVRFGGVPVVYFRIYVRFDAAWDEVMHHFFAIHGDHPDDMWSCHGDAGCRPNGEICLSGTTVDSREVNDGEIPGEPFFYTYHPDMTCDSEMSCANYNDPQMVCDGCANKGLPCDNGLECCWGNWYDPNQGASISMVQDTWYAIETMVTANTPGVDDGEMALWIDGELVAQHGGIGWRNVEELLLNHVIVWNYFPEVSSARSIWFDNLVVSTEPVGVLGGGATSGSSDGGADETGGATTASASDGEGTSPEGGITTATASAGDSGEGTGTSGGATSGEGDGKGCGCATDRGGAGALLLLAIAGLRRRRSTRASALEV
jgi:MYXO-CTERM domain-containing protein